MKKPTFIIIDVLQDFFKSAELGAIESSLTSSINELTKMARDSSCPIIWVRQEYKNDLSDAPLQIKDTDNRITIRGTDGCQLLSKLERSSNDLEIIKKRYSAFFETDLMQILEKLDPSYLVIAGINTHACIRSTAVDAYQRDFRIVFATDCIASYDQEYHRESMRYLNQAIGQSKTNTEIVESLRRETAA